MKLLKNPESIQPEIHQIVKIGKQMIEKGASTNLQFPSSGILIGLALLDVSFEKNLDFLKLLLTYPLDTNHEMPSIGLPLKAALMLQNPHLRRKAIKMLISNHALPDKQALQGGTARDFLRKQLKAGDSLRREESLFDRGTQKLSVEDPFQKVTDTVFHNLYRSLAHNHQIPKGKKEKLSQAFSSLQNVYQSALDSSSIETPIEESESDEEEVTDAEIFCQIFDRNKPPEVTSCMPVLNSASKCVVTCKDPISYKLTKEFFESQKDAIVLIQEAKEENTFIATLPDKPISCSQKDKFGRSLWQKFHRKEPVLKQKPLSGDCRSDEWQTWQTSVVVKKQPQAHKKASQQSQNRTKEISAKD